MTVAAMLVNIRSITPPATFRWRDSNISGVPVVLHTLMMGYIDMDPQHVHGPADTKISPPIIKHERPCTYMITGRYVGF